MCLFIFSELRTEREQQAFIPEATLSIKKKLRAIFSFRELKVGFVSNVYPKQIEPSNNIGVQDRHSLMITK